MEPCSQINKIAEIEQIARETSAKVDDLAKSHIELKEDIGIVKELAENSQVILRGRDGDLGLIADVRYLQKSVDGLIRTTTELVVALQGEKGGAGLVGVIAALQKSVGDLTDANKWVVRLIIGAVIMAVLGVIFI
jgi:hypothetical protein